MIPLVVHCYGRAGSGLRGSRAFRLRLRRPGVPVGLGFSRRATQARLDVVEPPGLGLSVENQPLEHQQPGRVVLVAVDLQAGQRLQREHRGRALRLHYRGDIDARRRHGERQLDGQLVAGGVVAAYGLVEPARDLGMPGRRDLVDHAALDVGVLRRHEAVALGAGQGRVDLPDVERPGAASALLEGSLELIAVGRPLVEQGKQPVTYSHTAYVYPVFITVSRHPRILGLVMGMGHHCVGGSRGARITP